MKLSTGGCVVYCASLLTALLLQPIDGWSPATYPNPQSDPARCGRPGVAKSWVCDPDRILTPRSRDVVEGILKDIAGARDPFAQASDCGSGSRLNEGYQVAVALAKEIELPTGQEPGAAAEAMAARLMDAWGVGEAGCNDGTVLLLSQNPRQVAIYAGAGAKRELHAKRIHSIIGAMRPLLRAERYDEAVEGAAVDIGIALAGGPAEGGGSVWGFVASVIFFSLFFCVLVTSCLQTWRRNRQVRACQGLLGKLKREQAVAAANNRFPATSCPVCLEDFSPPPPQAHQEPVWAPPGSSKAGDAAPSAPSLSAMEQEGGKEGQSEAELRARLLGAAADRAAASSSSSSSSGRGRQQAAQCDGAGCKPLVLPCGHSFCEGCLGRWLKDNNTCPMCRQLLTGDEQPPQPDHRSRASPWSPQSVETELLFRLGSLQRLYPTIITADLLAAWTHQVRSGASLNWPEIRSDLLSSEARSAHAAHGAVGASTSFGGGSSSGGAGASGSW